MPIITLTTDFGLKDWFVGTMKGVILGINPRATAVDIAHEIPPGDIRAGAFALMASCRFFPKGTVHVAVVDPGVGSDRRAIAVRTKDGYFVGPDNGVLSWALNGQTVVSVHLLENGAFFLPNVSATFHGRDIFAPVAAHLSRGVPISKFGARLDDIVCLPWPKPDRKVDFVTGEVIYIDRFGNAITNISTADLRALGSRNLRVQLGGKTLCVVGAFYQAVPLGRPVAVVGSSGLLEIAVNGGNAEREFRLQIGQVVRLRAHTSSA